MKNPVRLFLKVFILPKSKDDHPERVAFGILSASALASTLVLCGVEHDKLTCWLRRAACLFSSAVIPLAFISVCCWPFTERDANAKGRYYKYFVYWLWRGVVALSAGAFAAAVFCLVANFNKCIAVTMSIGVSICLLVQAVVTAWMDEHDKTKNQPSDRDELGDC